MSIPPDPAVLIVGAGPAGLAAAHALLERGVDSVLVVDRDEQPGGLPQYCHHAGFGWEYTRRLESGPRFVRRLLRPLARGGVRILPRTSVIGIGEGPSVEVIGPELRRATLRPAAVLLATGIRESARGSRMAPGERPERGVLTTGLLQQLVARGIEIPFRKMVVCGTEHVSYSAILTGRRIGLRTVAMVEPGSRVSSYRAADWAARLLGVRRFLGASIADIAGSERVESVTVVTQAGRRAEIGCDAVVFSAGWVPDAVLAMEGTIALDAHSRGPAIDQAMRSSAPGVFAAGNVLRGVESSGRAAIEGIRAGACIAAFLQGALPWAGESVPLEPAGAIEYVVPQRWDPAAPAIADAPAASLSIRIGADVARGRLRLQSDRGTRPLTRRRAFVRTRQVHLPASGVSDMLDRAGAARVLVD